MADVSPPEVPASEAAVPEAGSSDAVDTSLLSKVVSEVVQEGATPDPTNVFRNRVSVR